MNWNSNKSLLKYILTSADGNKGDLDGFKEAIRQGDYAKIKKFFLSFPYKNYADELLTYAIESAKTSQSKESLVIITNFLNSDDFFKSCKKSYLKDFLELYKNRTSADVTGYEVGLSKIYGKYSDLNAFLSQLKEEVPEQKEFDEYLEAIKSTDPSVFLLENQVELSRQCDEILKEWKEWKGKLTNALKKRKLSLTNAFVMTLEEVIKDFGKDLDFSSSNQFPVELGKFIQSYKNRVMDSEKESVQRILKEVRGQIMSPKVVSNNEEYIRRVKLMSLLHKEFSVDLTSNNDKTEEAFLVVAEQQLAEIINKIDSFRPISSSDEEELDYLFQNCFVIGDIQNERLMPIGKKEEFLKKLSDKIITPEVQYDEKEYIKRVKVLSVLSHKFNYNLLTDIDLFSLYKAGGKALLYVLDKKNKPARTITLKDIHELDDRGFSLMHYAAKSNNKELFGFLGQLGGNAFTLDREGNVSSMDILSMSGQKNEANKCFELYKKGVLSYMKDTGGLLNSKGQKDKFDDISASLLLAFKNDNQVLANGILDLFLDETRKGMLQGLLYRAITAEDADLVGRSIRALEARGYEYKEVPYEVKRGEQVKIVDLALRGNGAALKAILQEKPELMEKNIISNAVIYGNAVSLETLLKLDGKDGLDLDITGVIGKESLLKKAYDKRNVLISEMSDFLQTNPTRDSNFDEKFKSLYGDKILQIQGIQDCMKLLLNHKKTNPDKSLNIDIAFGLGSKSKDKKGESNDKEENLLIEIYLDLQAAKINAEAALKERGVKGNASVLDDQNVKDLSEIFNLLINHENAKLYAQGRNGKSLLMLAAEFNDINLCKKICEAENFSGIKKEFEKRDAFGNTVFHYAATHKSEDILKYFMDNKFQGLRNKGGALEDRKSNTNLVKNSQGVDALMIACHAGNYESVLALTDQNTYRFDAEQKDNLLNTPLHYLSKGKGVIDRKILRFLLSKGADIDAANQDGKTPLIEAVISGNADLIRFLIESGADVNKQDKLGNSPLLYACLLNQADLIDAILESRMVDINAKNNAGISPYTIVAQRDYIRSINFGNTINGIKDDANLIKEESSTGSKKIPEKEADKLLRNIWTPNAYEGLQKVLIERGAEISTYNEKDVYKAFLDSSNAIASAYLVAGLAGGVSSSYLSVPASIMKIITSAASSAYVYSNIQSSIKVALHNWLLDKKKDVSLDDIVMIGSITDKGLGFIKYGNALKSSIESNLDSSNRAIYDVDDLKMRVGNDRNKCFSALNTLTNKYISLQHTIANQPWYYRFMPWKGIGLNNAVKQILDAYDGILETKAGDSLLRVGDGDDSSTFEDIFKDVVQEINSPEKAKKIAAYILSSNDAKRAVLYGLTNDIIERRIPVSPKTFVHFYNLHIQIDKAFSRKPEFYKELEMKRSDKDSWQKGYKDLVRNSGFERENHEKHYKKLEESIKKSKDRIEGFKTNSREFLDAHILANAAAKSTSRAKQGISDTLLKMVYPGQDPAEIKANISQNVSTAAGTVLGSLTLSTMDPRTNAALFSVVLNSIGSGFSYLATGVSFGSSVVSNVGVMALSNYKTVAVMAGSYALYKYLPTIVGQLNKGVSQASKAVEDFAKNFNNAEIVNDDKNVNIRELDPTSFLNKASEFVKGIGDQIGKHNPNVKKMRGNVRENGGLVATSGDSKSSLYHASINAMAPTLVRSSNTNHLVSYEVSDPQALEHENKNKNKNKKDIDNVKGKGKGKG